MSGGHEHDHARRMLRQIAANLGAAEDEGPAAVAVASHLRRFWTPGMRAIALGWLEGGAEEPLNALERRALEVLRG